MPALLSSLGDPDAPSCIPPSAAHAMLHVCRAMSGGRGAPSGSRGLRGRGGAHLCLHLLFSGDIQAPAGRGAVQPALGDPAWTGGWTGGPTEVPANPSHAGILWFNSKQAPKGDGLPVGRRVRFEAAFRGSVRGLTRTAADVVSSFEGVRRPFLGCGTEVPPRSRAAPSPAPRQPGLLGLLCSSVHKSPLSSTLAEDRVLSQESLSRDADAGGAGSPPALPPAEAPLRSPRWGPARRLTQGGLPSSINICSGPRRESWKSSR